MAHHGFKFTHVQNQRSVKDVNFGKVHLEVHPGYFSQWHRKNYFLQLFDFT